MPRLTVADCHVGLRVRLASDYDHYDDRDFEIALGHQGTVDRVDDYADGGIYVRWDDGLEDDGLNPRWYLPEDFEAADTPPTPDPRARLTFADAVEGLRVQLASEYDHFDRRAFALPVGTTGTIVEVDASDRTIRVRWDDGLADGTTERWYRARDFARLPDPADAHVADLFRLFTGDAP